MLKVIIKNKKELLEKIPPEVAARRRILLNIAEDVLSELTPEKLFKNIDFESLAKPANRLVVISIGKAGKTMVRAVLPLLGRKPDSVLIADKGHPLPNAAGIAIGKKIISEAKRLGEKDVVIVLSSGGGSAMLVAPSPGITLEDKIKITNALLKCGANIKDMNVVRKHLSELKGGRLAALLYPARVYAFVISDVIGNDLSTIISGPFRPDKSTYGDALKIIKKYKVKVPHRVLDFLRKRVGNKELETPKPGEKCFKKVTTKIICDHAYALRVAVSKARKHRLKVHAKSSRLHGEARDVARKIVHSAKRGQLLIATGETTVTCTGNGHGGRNQELVLSGLRYLKPGQILLSIGTDGVDGMCPEAICGALGDSTILENADRKNLEITNFLGRNDSYDFFKKTGGLVKTGPTGTNVGDLIMLLQ